MTTNIYAILSKNDEIGVHKGNFYDFLITGSEIEAISSVLYSLASYHLSLDDIELVKVGEFSTETGKILSLINGSVTEDDIIDIYEHKKIFEFYCSKVMELDDESYIRYVKEVRLNEKKISDDV